MTRYARAKGSKASNERLPEDATPWHVMQQQMVNKHNETEEKKGESSSPTTKLNKKSLIAEKSQVENKLATWTSFGSENEIIFNKNYSQKNKKTTVNKQESKTINNVDNNHSGGHESEKEKVKSNYQTDMKIKSKNKNKGVLILEEGKKRNLHFHDGTESNNKKQRLSTQDPETSTDAKTADGHVGELVDKELNCESENSVKKKMYVADKFLQRKFEPQFNKNRKHFGVKPSRESNYQDRRADNEAFTMFCNGKAIKVAQYDGFLIQEKDAEELNKLKLQLIAKGIPRSEYLAVLKLERRKAEKALARERKNVCYRCRKSGHNFSECPEIGTDDVLGHCFKCGSTEHTHLGCKVSRGEEYRFAQCFLCKEQGHIAKQCPDNPRGLYPKGGGCHLCGDVTHFKKDCPKNFEEKEKKLVRVETFNKNSIEALDEELRRKSKINKLSKNKIVSF